MTALVFEVDEMRGNCPVYKKGDKIVVREPEIDLKETDAICIPALTSLLHYAVLRAGVDPVKLGLSKGDTCAYIQCLDPGAPYTDGGTVIFRCTIEDTLTEKRK